MPPSAEEEGPSASADGGGYTSFCGGQNSEAGEHPRREPRGPRLRTRDFASAEATKGLCDRPLETFAPCGGDSWKVAAALSAAVTTTQQQETAPNSQAEPSQKKRTTRTPAALRERGVWGERGFSQRSRLSPQNLSFVPHRLFGREREGGGFSTEKPPPSQ